jgi:serine/threonine-protein kinase RsbW
VAEPELQLELPARAENVIVVRQAVAGLGEALGMTTQRVDDLKTVVTEACNNVVVHAYEEGVDGPMIISAGADDRTVSVTVSDRGRGFRPRASEDDVATLGIGLPLIASLSDSFEIMGGAGSGTSTVARFSLRPAEQGDGEVIHPASIENLEIAIAPGEVVRPVLARVIGAMAARAQFSVDRLSDTVLLGDAVSAHPGDDFTTGRIQVSISDSGGKLAIRIGPLVAGGGERVLSQMDIPGGDSSLKALASRMEVTGAGDTEGDGEYLVVEVSN